jgi:hypothetical protein
VIPTIASRSQLIACSAAPTPSILAYLAQQSSAVDWPNALNAALIAVETGAKLPDGIPSIDHLLSATPSERLVMAHVCGKSKEILFLSLLKWIEELWEISQSVTTQTPLQSQIRQLDLLVEKIMELRYNLNPRLHLDHLVLAL